MTDFTIIMSKDKKLWEEIEFHHYDFPLPNYYYFWGRDADDKEDVEAVQDFFRENNVGERQVQELTEIVYKLCDNGSVCVKIQNNTVFIVTE